MAHNLTEVAVFSNNGTLQVPDGTDDHHFLSDYIEFIAQTLANRSQALKVITDVAALKNAANTFTQANTFNAQCDFNGLTTFDDQLYVNNNDANRPAFQVDAQPSDDPTAGNKWKVICEWRTGTTGAGGQRARIFTGRDGTAYGSLAIVVNATWNVTTQVWDVRDTALPASALIWRYDGVYYSQVAAGPATFADWPRQHTTEISILAGVAHATYNGAGEMLGGSIPSIYTIPLRLPHGAQVSSFEFQVYQDTAIDETFRLDTKTIDWASPGAPALASITTFSGSATGYKNVPMSFVIPYTVDSAKECALVWIPGATNSRLAAVRATWTDPGLRNF